MSTDDAPPDRESPSPGEPSASNSLARIRRYRLLGFASLLAGVVALALAAELGRVIVGVIAYWLGFAGFLAAWKGTDVELFDERDRRLEERAAASALTALAFLLVVLWPAAVALQTGGHVTLPAKFVGAVYGYVLVYAAFAAFYVVYRYRP